MSHLFECPYCGSQTLVDPQYLGQSGPCANCGRVIRVPSARQRASVPRGWPFMLSVVLLGLLAVAAIGVFVYAVVMPSAQTRAMKTQTQASSANLARIAQALQAYEQVHGAYPPAITLDEFGQPMHSWRVLILPQLGFQKLYQQYKLNEAWDSQNNLGLVNQMPPIFASPDDPTAAITGATNYFAIVGARSMFPDTVGFKRRQISDGLAQTLMLIEVDSSAVTWTRPIDYNADNDLLTDGATAQNQRRTDGRLTATADGRVHFLRPNLAPEVMSALVSANGGEPANIGDHEQ